MDEGVSPCCRWLMADADDVFADDVFGSSEICRIPSS